MSQLVEVLEHPIDESLRSKSQSNQWKSDESAKGKQSLALTAEAPPKPVVLTKMLVTVLEQDEEHFRRAFPVETPIRIGRASDCHIVLPSQHVSRHHLTLKMISAGLELGDSSRGGTLIGKKHRLLGKTTTLSEHRHDLMVGPYRILVRLARAEGESKEQRREIHARLLEKLNLRGHKIGHEISQQLRVDVRTALNEIVAEPEMQVRAEDRKRVAAELENEVLGLGPLEALLADPLVSEIMVVDAKTIYAERSGKLELTGRHFTDCEAVRSTIERIVAPLGRRIDESSPLVDARLKDGSRVNAVIPPLALRGPCITIRKFPARKMTMTHLVEQGSLCSRMARFLERSVALKKNIVISGGTGSGKTTLLNILSASIGRDERIVTVEDAAELSLAQSHVVGLESKPPNLEGRGEFTIRDLVKNALRMRPDRIVVGECRGGEALDMLQAMNTGHEGSMTTTHANDPRQAVSRLETLCLMAGLDLPLGPIRRQIAQSIDLIIQQARLGDGSRRVTSIVEVIGLDDEGHVELRELFRWDRDFVDGNLHGGRHVASGFMPSYLAALRKHFGAEKGGLF